MRIAVLIALLLTLGSSPAPVLAATRIAVQPFGAGNEPYRRQVAKIVARHGYKVVTSLPAVSGTGQYPGLAKDKRLSAFVVADVDERGSRVLASFVVWQGVDGSVIGRWEIAGTKRTVTARISREFWKRLGPVIGRAMAPPSDVLPPAPTIRINAGPDGPPRARHKARHRAPTGIRTAPVAVSL